MKSKVVLTAVALLGTAALLGAGFRARAGGTPTYVGSGKCKPCHFKQHKSWSETKMGKSFEMLRAGAGADKKKQVGLDPQKDYTKDPKCLACHSVGYGKTGGYTSEADTPDRMGVGCEMCHGPGSAYVEIMRSNASYKKAEVLAAGLISPPTKEQCLTCHNTQSPFIGKDYVFDFEQRKVQGTHEHFPLTGQH